MIDFYLPAKIALENQRPVSQGSWWLVLAGLWSVYRNIGRLLIMRKFSNYLLLGVILFTQTYWVAAAVNSEINSTFNVCEHAETAKQSNDSHQLCDNHDCHASAHYLAVVATFTLTPPVMTHSQARSCSKHYLSYQDPPPTQPPRSTS